MKGTLSIVSLGPGDLPRMTAEARRALQEADLVVGYTGYLRLVADLVAGKETYGSSMTAEVDRAAHAVDAARSGRAVAVIASGDACVYGIGGLVLELLGEEELSSDRVTVVPGVTAANAAAALLGAPLMNDYCVLSLSDLLTDRELILRRVHAVGAGDLVVALYNARSRTRVSLLPEVCAALLEYRAADVPVGVVRKAYRDGQAIRRSTLGEIASAHEDVDMFTIIVIGNSQTVRRGDRLITPRGYAIEPRGSGLE